MFAAAKGMNCQDFLDALHARLRFDWYFEIGSGSGRSLQGCASPAIAVDPKFRTFPAEPVALAYSDKPPVFFGSLNDRRKAELLPLQEAGKVILAPHGTFGRALGAVLKDQGGVLNIHFADGEYAEYPRFLKAYLHGKPVFSEPMAPPLVAGTHYFAIGEVPTRKATETLFGNIAALAAEYSFQTYLEGVASTASQKQRAG